MEQTYAVNGNYIIRPINGHTIDEVVKAMKLDEFGEPRIDDISNWYSNDYYDDDEGRFEDVFESLSNTFPEDTTNEDNPWEATDKTMAWVVKKKWLINQFCRLSITDMMVCL